MTISRPEQKQGVEKYFIEPAAPPISLLYLGEGCGGWGVGGRGVSIKSQKACVASSDVSNTFAGRNFTLLYILHIEPTLYQSSFKSLPLSWHNQIQSPVIMSFWQNIKYNILFLKGDILKFGVYIHCHFIICWSQIWEAASVKARWKKNQPPQLNTEVWETCQWGCSPSCSKSLGTHWHI